VQLGVYRLMDKLGHGGMGAVYKAWHCRLKRLAALKILPLERMQDGQAVARFHREMELIGRLDHPNVVRATDAGEAGGIHFLIMELVDGIDLGRLARWYGPLAVADACAIAYQTAIGLHAVQAQGLVHRDIKPSNLMLTKNGEVKILDLGLACIRGAGPGEELTTSGLLMGTADYMAPEQGTDPHHVDIRADLYSLGCTLYKLLTGKPPFDGSEYNSVSKKVQAHANQSVPSLRDVCPAVPLGLAAVVEKLTAKDKVDRYGTPSEAADALRPFCDGADLRGLFEQVTTERTRSDSAPVPQRVGDVEITPKASTLSAQPSKPLSDPAGSHRRAWKKRWIGLGAALVVMAAIAATLLALIPRPLGPPSTEPTPAPADEGAAPSAAKDADHRAVEWVRANDGTVEVLLPGQDVPQKLGHEIPAAFQVVKIDLSSSKKVEDEGLKNLLGLSHLQALSLHETTISDAGLVHVAQLTSLQTLDLYLTKITDAGLERVGRLHHLDSLSLHNTAVTDAGLRHLGELKELTSLNLANTRVSDAGLARLAGLKKLTWLQLSGTAIGDEGLRRLGPLSALTEVYVGGTNVSEKGVASLQLALPGCRIIR